MPKIDLKLEAVLIDFDGPQLVELRTSSSQRYFVAVAIPDHKDYRTPFFGCEVRKRSYLKYLEGSADLFFVFRTAKRGKFYYFDIVDSNQIVVSDADPSLAMEKGHWPDRGLFSYSHTTDHRLSDYGNGEQKYFIDGKWEVQDFAQLNYKISDLYALCSTVNQRNDDDVTNKTSIAIQTRLFKGGGSYRGLFDDLKDNVDADLHMRSVEYASPGQLTVSGNAQALKELSDLILAFKDFDVRVKAERLSSELNKILKSEGLLAKGPRNRFSDTKIQKLAVSRAEEIYNLLGLDDFEWVKSVCGQNPLLISKFVRSIYKRASMLHAYLAEGRLTNVENS